MYTGLSLSQCVVDIAKGVIPLSQVARIIAFTTCTTDEDWANLINDYRTEYWEEFPTAVDIVWELVQSRRIAQPVLVNPEYVLNARVGTWVYNGLILENISLGTPVSPVLGEILNEEERGRIWDATDAWKELEREHLLAQARNIGLKAQWEVRRMTALIEAVYQHPTEFRRYPVLADVRSEDALRSVFLSGGIDEPIIDRYFSVRMPHAHESWADRGIAFTRPIVVRNKVWYAVKSQRLSGQGMVQQHLSLEKVG